MELKQYWFIVRKWWWLLVLCTILGAGVSYLVSSHMEPTYEASSLVMIGGSVDIVDPDTGSIQTSEKLAQTYAQLLKARPILEATQAALGLPAKPDVSVTLLSNTQLLRITVSDSDPARAAATADELANQLISQSPSDPQREEQSYRAFVNEQLAELESEIADLTEAIAAANDTASADEIARLQDELNARRSSYSSLLSYIKDSSTNYIQVIETAAVPTVPTSPKVMQNTLLAAVVGLMLAAGAAFLIEYLDDSVKGQAEIEEALGLPTLGVVAEIAVEGATPELITVTHPRSAFAEAYRMLRTNLHYSLPATKQRVFMITSVEPGVGKTTTTSNLAVALAQAGQRVILVDGDLRRPSVHKVFGCPNDTGLTPLLVGEVTSVEAAIHTTEVPGLRVLPCGPLPPNAAELLDSPRMGEVLQELVGLADVVLLDSPPLFAVADARILASLATGVILVVQAGRTSMTACIEAQETLKTVGGALLGVVLNRLRLKRGGYGYSYYGGYYYNYYYAYGADGEKHKQRVRKGKRHHEPTQTEPGEEQHSPSDS